MIAPPMSRRAVLLGSITASASFLFSHHHALGEAKAAEPDLLTDLTASQAVAGLKAGRFSAFDYADALLKRSDALRHLNAFISQDAQAVGMAAKRIDQALAGGDETAPLLGLPLAIKDNINTADLPTTGGTPALKAWRPSSNAQVVQNLLDAGVLLAGKTNLHELAFGITSNNVTYGAVGNPYGDALIAGGSSGGTAAAVAARMVPAGLGTDTGGSCRIPAALCGCVGFRPTIERYSQEGVIPISHTRDTIGPLARSVEDVALLDGICAYSRLEPFDKPIEQLRIGVPASYFYENLDFELEAVVAKALENFRGEGAQLIDVDVEDVQALNEAVSLPIALFEVLRELGDYLYRNDNPISVMEVVKQAGGEDVRNLLITLMGDEAVPAGLYRDVLEKRRPALQQTYERYFDDNQLDALVVPTTPLPARPIGHEETIELNGEQQPTFATYIRNTDPPSNAGLPCLSVPAGLTASGLPVGVEFVGPSGGDAAVLHIGALFEAVTSPLPSPKI